MCDCHPETCCCSTEDHMREERERKLRIERILEKKIHPDAADYVADSLAGA